MFLRPMCKQGGKKGNGPTMLPTVAIVGRPNVGKSTLFNRLVGKKLALVDDQPGVTRDRREGQATLLGVDFTIIDTAGYEDEDPQTLPGRMRMQTQAAVESADLALFLVDARAGITPMDEEIARWLREGDLPVVLVANKAEGRNANDGVMESYVLGLGEPVPLSAEHGQGMADLFQALLPYIDREEDEEEDAELEEADIESAPLKLAIVGRPNAGKSTLINRLLGENRLLTGPEAGITRDSIAVDWQWADADGNERPVRLIDTAGMRKRAKVQDKLEKLAVSDGLNAVNFAEVVVLLLDATIPFEKQDLALADLVEREGRAIVIAVNKWDLIEDKNEHLKMLREECERLLPQLRGVPLVTLSGLTGKNIDKLMDAIFAIERSWNVHVSTARLNRWLAGMVDGHPPPAVSGRRLKLRYMTQAKTRPPSFILFASRPDVLPMAYQRYLVNGLREAFDIKGTPIRLWVRGGSANPYDDKGARKIG